LEKLTEPEKISIDALISAYHDQFNQSSPDSDFSEDETSTAILIQLTRCLLPESILNLIAMSQSEAPDKPTELIINPDGQLNLVPFEALLGSFDGQTIHFLIELFNISYVTSYLELDQTSCDKSSDSAIFYSPDYGEGNLFQPLPSAEAEGGYITERVAPNRPYSGELASKENVLSLSSPRVLHFATHGYYHDSGGGLYEDALFNSGIALSGANLGEDGLLNAAELMELNLSGTSLTAISACKSGQGSAVHGEGVYGLRRSVALAGSLTTLVGLWNLDDEKTSELIKAFYDKLIAGESVGEALRKSKIEFLNIRRKEYDEICHPYYWAGLVTSGHTKTTIPKPKKSFLKGLFGR